MSAYVVMVGTRVRAVLTDAGNNGDGLAAAADVARQLASSSTDEPQDIARENAVWIARSPNLDGVEVP
jgi:hypothetical protein